MKVKITILFIGSLLPFLIFSQEVVNREGSLKSTAFTSHLPLMMIDTYGQTIIDEPKRTVGIKVIDNGPGRISTMARPVSKSMDNPLKCFRKKAME
jgi:hypothetical protein